MKRIIIIPDYDDNIRYFQRLLQRWHEKQGYTIELYVFGWSTGVPESYERKWANFVNHLQQIQPAAIIGIGAGASVALRALKEYPSMVSAVVNVCGPASSQELDPHLLNTQQPLLKTALGYLSVEGIDYTKILTLRPNQDNVIPPESVMIGSARNLRMLMFGHLQSIIWALYGRQRTILKFLNSKLNG